MIGATMFWQRMRLEVTGHANYAEAGKDIVCAGASALVYALGQTLEEAEARGRCECKCKDRGGIITIWANPTMGSVSEIKAYFRMCITGLRMLEEQHTGYVSVKEVQ
jgi:hypothetical protein